MHAVGGETTRQVPEFSRAGGGGAINARFFELSEDVSGPTVLGKQVTLNLLTGTFNPPALDATEETLVNWSGLLDGALEGDVFDFVLIDGNWVFNQGPCIGGPAGEDGNALNGGNAAGLPTSVVNGGNASSIPIENFEVDGGNA